MESVINGVCFEPIRAEVGVLALPMFFKTACTPTELATSRASKFDLASGFFIGGTLSAREKKKEEQITSLR